MIRINKKFLQKGPIEMESVLKTIHSEAMETVGAQSYFLGQVRADTVDNKKVTGIEYSAYDEMVSTEMQKIINIIIEKYADIKRIKILHSTGLVKVGEISLLVFVACGHRVQSFKAVEEIVNLIKERIPVWKKEFLEDSSHIWTENEN